MRYRWQERQARKSADGGTDLPASTDPRLLLLHEDDNVLVARRRIVAGETIRIGGEAMTLEAPLLIGHKLARRDIAAGEKILKYGAPIGSATVAIPHGAHVHVHNVKSDYTPTYHLIDAQAAAGGSA